jgi:hypothetical protein
MKHFTKTLLAAGALAVSALSHAAPVIDWNVAASGTWTAFAPNPGVSNPNPLTLQWGTSTGSGQSSLVITNPATTNIPTWYGGGTPPAGYIAPSIALTHTNNPITGSSLTSATLSVGVTLTPTNPAGPNLPLPTIAYNIAFTETPNSTPCAATSPPGVPCNDIFVLIDGFLNESFVYDGQTYFVNAFPTSGGNLSTLSASACAAAGRPAGCFGFTTVEGQATNLAFGLTISSERLQVPEPGSLALIGLALAGLGFVSRRRSAA